MTKPFLLAITLVYAILTIVTLNNYFFWDVIQLVSIEGHWYYESNFASLAIPNNNHLNIWVSGHPPLMPIMTAMLWKVFGQYLWVSSVFTAFWAILLIVNSWKLISRYFPKKYAGWVFLIVLLEPTVLTQFAISSPDFILFTAFVIALRAVLERKPILLAVGLFFLCCISIRGFFAGVGLFLANQYYTYLQNENQFSIKLFFRTFLPYLPTLTTLIIFYVIYFSKNGWFFADSGTDCHYAMPQTWEQVVRRILVFGLRLLEQGRFAVWALTLFFVFVLIKRKEKLSAVEKTLALFAFLVYGLYFLFVFITQMPFSQRYFMPQFFLLTILTLMFVVKYFNAKRIKVIICSVLFLVLSGHFWLYSDRIYQPWEQTLLHLPFYKLRTEVFNYIDENNFDYNDLSAGFSLAGNRGFIELAHYGKVVSSTNLNKRYFIYSNISFWRNDRVIELRDAERWQPIKTFRRGVIFITIYRNLTIID